MASSSHGMNECVDSDYGLPIHAQVKPISEIRIDMFAYSKANEMFDRH